MLGLFKKKDPIESKKQQYAKLLEDAMNLQRNGDIRGAAAKTSEADALLKEIESLEAAQASS